MRFKPQIDYWIKFVLLFSVFAMYIPLYATKGTDFFILLGSALFVTVLILPILFVGYYELKEDYLQIRIWFLSKKIKYKNIESIQEAKGLQNNYALSRKRVRIREFGKSKYNYTDVSPIEMEQFIFELNSKIKKHQNKEY